MEIKTVQDLIPYRNSLEAVWQQEDFQPVLKLLSSTYQDGLAELLYKDWKGKTDSEVRAEVVGAQSKLKLVASLYDLPKVIKQAEEEFEKQQQAKMKFAGSQESGSIPGQEAVNERKEIR